MSTQTDVKSASVTASGTGYAATTRVKGIVITNTAVAGSVTFKDGGSGGTSRISIVTPAVGGMQSFYIPGEGVKFNTDVYVTLSGAEITGVTFFYG